MNEGLHQRAETLFREDLLRVRVDTDHAFGWLLLFQWALAIALACFVSPLAWEGTRFHVHLHVWLAILFGGVITLVPFAFTRWQAGRTQTRHIVAVNQMLMSALLIHVTGGRIETHFHIFGSLAFLLFYRDWRVLVTASVVIALDHFLRGIYWSQSVYGVLSYNPWRWLEHVAWVVFADIFLVRGCLHSLREMRQIAERQAQSEDLRRSQALILQSAGDGIFGIDEQGLITFANPAAARLCGWKPEQLIGRHAHQTWHHSRADKSSYPVTECPIYFALRDGASHTQHDDLFWRQDGSSFPVDYVSTPMIEKEKVVGAVVIFQDITERRRLLAALILSDKLAAIGQFAAGVAHDLNNPIGVMLGYSADLVDRLPKTDKTYKPWEAIKREALRCKTLVQNLLAFSRGNPQEQMKPEELNGILDNALALVSTLTIARKIRLVRLPRQELPLTSVDGNQIQQVIINLCTNAMDAMPQGGTLTVGLEASAEAVKIIVQDTGTGIPPEIRAHIFEAFFTTKEAGKGTGLGLSIISDIIKKHHGKIDLQSEVGQGTTFTIELPFGDHSSTATLMQAA